ncbi:MAG: hypothetical protein QOE86_505 [Solirubrobacteraceae bacterium]|jgi:hypothetical protein|nr:hypothetical protein [Solirubrobacteraceae bacterium]
MRGPHLPPIETPGPSVPAPAEPESDTQRAEWAEGTKVDADRLIERDSSDDPVETWITREAETAGREAAEIGGCPIREPGLAETRWARRPGLSDREQRWLPVYQGGGGEQEGWEAAEGDLVDFIENCDRSCNPSRDASTPELEADRASVEYGEADGWPQDPDRWRRSG